MRCARRTETRLRAQRVRYGRRFRVVPLPPGLRSRTVAARYVNGVLEVTAAVGAVEPRTPAFAVTVGDDPSSVPTTRDFRP